MNTITVELSATDRELLNNLLEAIKGQQNCTQCAQITGAYAQELKELHSAPKAEEPVAELVPEEEPEVTPEPVEEHEPEEEHITRDDVLKLVRELSKTPHFGTARDIVQSYAKSVSDIPEDKIAEVYAKLNELG